MVDLTPKEWATIAKSLHRTGKDLERSIGNAERRDRIDLVAALMGRLAEIRRILTKVERNAEGVS